MRDYVIMTDSSCDLPVEMASQLGIHIVPMGVVINGKDYKHYNDYRELSHDDYFELLKDCTGSTSGTNILDATDEMRKVLETNRDILYLSLSSGLSCSYQNACLAAEELCEEYPNAKIIVIDTKCVSLSVGLLVYLASKKKEMGYSIENNAEYIESIKTRVHITFTVDDLSALQRSGRISHLTSIVGAALGIKPVFDLAANGKIRSLDKARGRKGSIRNITTKCLEDVRDSELFAIVHSDALDEAMQIQDTIKEQYPDAMFMIGEIGPIIGINTGLKTIAVICIGEERE